MTLYLNARLHLFTFFDSFVQNKCSFIYFSNIFLNEMLQINVREGFFSNFMNGLLKINVPNLFS